MTARRKCIFPSIFFLRMSRHFAGSKLLHIAASLYSEYVTAGLICFLSFQAYFPPVGGKTLGAFQSRIIKKTETPYIFMYFFFLFFCYLYFSSFVFPNWKLDNKFFFYFAGKLFFSLVFNYSPASLWFALFHSFPLEGFSSFESSPQEDFIIRT